MLKKIILPLLFFFAVLRGQTPVTLDWCLQTGLKNDPGLASAEMETDIAVEDSRQALASFFPSIDASGSFRHQSTVPKIEIPAIQLPFGGSPISLFPGGGMELGLADTYDFRLTASQPLFTGLRLFYRKKMADAAAAAKRMEQAQKRNDLLQRIETAFGGVLKAKKFLEIAQTGNAQVASHLEDVGHFYDQGLIKQDEWLKAKVRKTEAELAVLQAENGIVLAIAALEAAVGAKLPPDPRFEVAAPADTTGADPVVSVRTALSNRPELLALASARAAADAGKGLARGGLFPSIAAFGTLGYGRPGLDFVGKKWMDYWLVGVGAEWNLWSWGKTRSQMRQAGLKSSGLAETERQARAAVTLEATQASLRLDEARRRLDLTLEMESQALESYRVAEHLYRQGQSSHADFFDAQSENMRSRLARAQAEIDLMVARANWRRAVGGGDAITR
jgi:outer membrane protein